MEYKNFETGKVESVPPSKQCICAQFQKANPPSFGSMEEMKKENLPPKENPANAVLYRIEKHALGKGSSARVRLAVNIETQQLAACKIIRKVGKSEASLQRLKLEVELLSRLQAHDHILKLLAHAEDDCYIFVFTELVCGGNLATQIGKSGPLKEARARHLFAQLLSAVQYTHAQGVVHRDIKLENVLYDPHTDQVRLADFGLGDFMVPDASITENEKLFTRYCGSPSYAAPELCTRQPYRGAPVDVWSLGVLLYLMVFGVFPFGSSLNHKLILHRIVHNPLCFPDRPNVSSNLKYLLMRMLTKDPASRITLDQVLQSRWMTEEIHPFPLRRPSTPRRIWDRFVERFLSSQNQAYSKKEVCQNASCQSCTEPTCPWRTFETAGKETCPDCKSLPSTSSGKKPNSVLDTIFSPPKTMTPTPCHQNMHRLENPHPLHKRMSTRLTTSA